MEDVDLFLHDPIEDDDSSEDCYIGSNENEKKWRNTFKERMDIINSMNKRKDKQVLNRKHSFLYRLKYLIYKIVIVCSLFCIYYFV